MPEILLIDDNHDNLIIISELLENNIDDCNVVTARSGAEGIKKAKEVFPDIIFLDIIMPGMDGFQVCKKLKNNSKTADIPIVLISAIKTDTESRIKGLNAGAYGLIERPIDKNELTAMANAMLRISKSINKGKNSLKEKELLLSEIHHRVKNNLQVINSLLNLQIKYIRDEYDKGLFKETRSRIYTMSLIHEKLYQTRNLANIEFKSYIKELANQLFNSYQQDINIIEYIIEAEDIILGVDLAIPCAQIINELLSNSLKYAFPNGKKGMVKINLSKINNGKHTLIVSDNGIGFPEDIDIINSDSLGFKIVNALVNQLKGEIKLDRSRGTKLTITF